MKKWMLCFITILVCITGCGANNKVNEPQNSMQKTINVKNSTVQNIDRYTGQEIARHLVELASSIPNVNDATAIVLGNFAIVGIDVDKDIERSEVGSIKYAVAESLKNDPHGARSIVIADPDMTARLREIRDDIANGEPVQGIINELADISGRLMPEVPADIIDPEADEKKLNGQQGDKLKQSENKQLKKEQDDQSNHHLD